MICEPDAGRRIILGRIVGIYGVQGWMKIHSYTRPAQGIFEYRRWLVRQPDQQWQAVDLGGWRPQGKALLVKLEGVAERDQARAWIGSEIAIPRSALPPLPAGEYYWADLIGLRVLTREGVDLGAVDHLIETGANDVLVIAGERERLVPFVLGRDVIAVDIAAAQIHVDWDPQF